MDNDCINFSYYEIYYIELNALIDWHEKIILEFITLCEIIFFSRIIINESMNNNNNNNKFRILLPSFYHIISIYYISIEYNRG